jgi:TM2 domain-containing membrane protein YozV
MLLNADTVDNEEEALRKLLAALDDEQKHIAWKEIDKRIRDPDTYATLNWFFICGLHHFYLGKYLRGTINLLLFLAGVIGFLTAHVLTGVLLIATVTVIELYALFRSQVIVKDYNNRETRKVLDRLTGSARTGNY